MKCIINNCDNEVSVFGCVCRSCNNRTIEQERVSVSKKLSKLVSKWDESNCLNPQEIER